MATTQCTISFQGTDYSEDQFKDVLSKGLMFNLLDRGVIDLPIDKQSVKPETNTRQFNEHFVSSKADVEKSLTKVFGLPLGQAKAVADLYYRVAKSWAVRTGKSVSDYFNTLSIFKGTSAVDKINNILSQEEPLVRDAVRIGYDYNTEKVARERFDIPKLGKPIGSGSDRDVYDLGDGKVLKIAKTARGLEQNLAENDRYLIEKGAIPDVYESGLNYNVVEKVNQVDPYSYRVDKVDGKYYVVGEHPFGQMENPDNEKYIPAISYKDAVKQRDTLNNTPGKDFLRKLSSNKGLENREALLKEHNIPDVSNDYSTLAGDYQNPENWGYREDGSLVHLDGGTFAGSDLITNYKGKKDLEDADFREIYNRSKELKKQFGDTDKNKMYQMQTSAQARDAVAKGFGLQADSKAFSGAYRTESGKATPELAKRINDWLKENGYDNLLEYKYEKTYGTVNAIPKGELFNQEAKGAILLGQDGKDIIYALSNPDVSTPVHELTHRWERELTDEERKTVLDWSKQDTWDRDTSEKFARGFEKFLSDGKAPSSALEKIFNAFKQWLVDIYKGVKGSSIDIELNEGMKEVYSKMLGENYEQKLNEEVQQEAANETTPVTPQEQPVQEPQTEPALQVQPVQPVQQVPTLEDTQTWKKPFVGSAEEKVAYTNDVQENYLNGNYDQLIASGDMSEEDLRNIVTSAGLTADLTDRVIFRALNKGLNYSVDNLATLNGDAATPEQTSEEFQMVSNYMINDGRLEDAIKNDMISPYDAKTILDNTKTENEEVATKKEALNKLVDSKIEEKIKLANDRIAKLKAQLEEVPAPTVEETPKAKEFVKVSQDEGIRSEKLPKNATPELRQRQSVLVNVAERLRKVLPSVPVDLILDSGDWKGRIKDGRAEINMNKADLNTPIHEMLHPFILDLKNRNKDLYFNLNQELRLNFPDYVDSVKANSKYDNLSDEEKEDEALVQYLGDTVQKYFNQDGTINQDLINQKLDEAYSNKQQSAFFKFLSWLQDTVRAFWNTIENLKKSKKQTVNDMDYVTYNKETGSIIGNKAKLIGEQVEEGQRRTQDDRSFRVQDTDESELNSRNITPDVLKQIKDIASESKDNIVEIKKSALILASINKSKLDATPTTNVTALPIDFTLQNVADVLGAQQQLSFDLSGSQHAIDAMEAYQFDQATASDRFMKRTQDRLEQLRDTAERRTLVGEIATDNVIGLKRILRDYKGVEAMNAYIEYGVRSLNGANWLVHQIQDTLSKAREGFVAGRDANDKLVWIKSDTDPLTDKLINELNDRLFQARQLIGFYEDADENSLTKLTSIYSEGFDEKELGHFNKILKSTNEVRTDIGKIANGLITDWLYPTIEKAQENLPDHKKITRQQFSQNLRVADQDVSTISYWMQAVINSRDPINAALAIVIKDKLVSHHEEERQTNFELRNAYAKFLSDKGIPNTQKAVEDFYKQNYLRKAKTWEVFGFKKVPEDANIGDTVKYGKYDGVITSLENGVAKVSGYMERDAFHEKFHWDRYFDDLRLFKEGYENRFGHPAGDNQWDAFNKAVADWDAQNNPQYGGTKYVNQNFAALANDEYFNMLYKTYKDSNEKYGERKLNYGIVPQAYRKNNSLVSTWEILKAIPENLKATFSDKTKPTSEKIESLGADVGNFMFDKQPYLREQDLNLDGSYYRGVKSPFTHLIDPDHLDLRLNESVLGFQSAANMFTSLREVQSNVENLKMLIEGNPLFSIKGRQVVRRSPSNVSASNPTGTIFDRFAKRPEKDYAVKLNKQLTSFINDIFYGDGEFQSNVALGKVNINLNAAGSRLGFLTALHTMAGSLFGGISNVTIGNIMTLGESIGGKYYKPKNWAWAQKEYAIRIPNFLADISNPVKSKITQLGILYDAIQGEFRDKYGKNITGSAIKRYATNDTFFIVNHTGEHQIQLTGMLALMDATKVTLRDGSKVSLYDAYKVNDKGFYKLRDDAVWSKEDDAKFIKTLHGISRDLNGNYAAFDKSMLQRYWWGKLAMQYRKYLYSAWRSRFASERVDWERGDIQAGYYRTFLTKFWQDAKNYNGNIIASTFNTIAGKKGFTAEQHYARRRTMFDIAVIVGTTMLAGSLAGMEKENQDDADKKAQERLLLTVLRFRSDISQYSWTLPQNVWQTVDNPSASLQLLQNYGKFFSQILNDPTETYSQNGSGYNKGDSKLGNKFEKIVPLYRQWLRWQTPDQQIKFYSLYGKNVKPGANDKSN